MESVENLKEGGKKMEAVARENFARWNEALQTKDPKKAAAFYAEDATFLPTVSPDFKHGVGEAEGYFKHFLLKNPDGRIKADSVQVLGAGVYLHSGLYDFELDSPEGGRTVVEARFSYVWAKRQDQWLILHHHSSVRPKV